MIGSFQKSRNCVRTTMKDAQQITCQSSLTCTRDPEAWTTIHQQETMTQHSHAVADHGRRQHRTATGLPDLIRPILPRPHTCSRVVNKCTTLFKTMSGMCGQALDCDHPPTVTQRRDNTVTVQPQDSAWMGAMFELWTGGASRVPTRTWFPLETTRHRASERARASEGCGPGGVYPVDL